jgi:hypothetical protein
MAFSVCLASMLSINVLDVCCRRMRIVMLIGNSNRKSQGKTKEKQ